MMQQHSLQLQKKQKRRYPNRLNLHAGLPAFKVGDFSPLFFSFQTFVFEIAMKDSITRFVFLVLCFISIFNQPYKS